MEKYILAHEEYDITPLTMSPNLHAWSTPILRKLLDGNRVGVNTFCYYKNNSLKFYVDGYAWDKGSDYLIKKIKANDKFIGVVKKESLQLAKEIFAFIRKMERIKPENLTNRQIADILFNSYKKLNELSAYGFIPVLSDHLFNKYTNILKSILRHNPKINKIGQSPSEIFTILTSPIRNIPSGLARLKLLSLASRSKSVSSEIEKKLLLKWYSNWHWFSYGHIGPGLSLAELYVSFGDLAKNNKVLKKEFNQLDKNNLLKQQRQLFTRLNLNKSQIYLFKVAQLFTYLKGLRMETSFGVYYHWHRLLVEVAKRTNTPIEFLYYCSIAEITSLLNHKADAAKLKLKKRLKGIVWVAQTNIKASIMQGRRASNYLKYHVQPQDVLSSRNVMIIHGTVASVGYAKGPVKIVNSVKQMKKVNSGDILVSVATSPALVPVMKKAAAFVTDVGGINSHAAIVARELRKPCIIGTKIATKVLKDGDIVEIDTRRGDIRRIVYEE